MKVSVYPNLEAQFTSVNASTSFHLRKFRMLELLGDRDETEMYEYSASLHRRNWVICEITHRA